MNNNDTLHNVIPWFLWSNINLLRYSKHLAKAFTFLEALLFITIIFCILNISKQQSKYTKIQEYKSFLKNYRINKYHFSFKFECIVCLSLSFLVVTTTYTFWSLSSWPEGYYIYFSALSLHTCSIIISSKNNSA